MYVRMSIRDNMMNVLKAIIENPTNTNMSIANKLGLSCTGVGKIRDKLETSGIIKGYSASIDFDAIGLNTFGLIHLKVTKEGWQYKGHKGVEDYIVSNPNIYGVYRIPGRDITHIIFCTFRNFMEMDKFIHAIQTQLADYIEIVDTYVFSAHSIIKESRTMLMSKMIDEMEEQRMPEPVLFGTIMGEDE